MGTYQVFTFLVYCGIKSTCRTPILAFLDGNCVAVTLPLPPPLSFPLLSRVWLPCALFLRPYAADAGCAIVVVVANVPTTNVAAVRITAAVSSFCCVVHIISLSATTMLSLYLK
jgi:hypothetical protein